VRRGESRTPAFVLGSRARQGGGVRDPTLGGAERPERTPCAMSSGRTCGPHAVDNRLSDLLHHLREVPGQTPIFSDPIGRPPMVMHPTRLSRWPSSSFATTAPHSSP